MKQQRFQNGIEHLSSTDPIMRELIQMYGDCRVPSRTDSFLVLCESIISQQLSVKAAASICRRFMEYFHNQPTDRLILSAPEDELRALGLSYSKIKYLKDLALHHGDGRLEFEEMGGMSNEEIIDRLIQVKGIGRWTAEMFLIFGLGRFDVFPVDDLGIKKAIQFNYGLADLPGKDEMRAIGQAWAPYESIASLYLWRSLNNKPPIEKSVK